MEHGVGKLVAQAVHAHPGQHEIEAIASRIVAADRGARLDWRDDEAVVDEFDFDDMRRAYRDALPVLSSKEKWETVLLEVPSAPDNAVGNGRHHG